MRCESKPENVFIIAITGGVCAGNSAFAEKLHQALGVNFSHVISQDSYYHDQADLNYPQDLDFKLLHQHLQQLEKGQPVAIPIYDFQSRRRLPERQKIRPAEVIIIEGRFLLTSLPIVKLCAEIIFLDLPNRQQIVDQTLVESARTYASYQIIDHETYQFTLEDLVDKIGIDSQASFT